MPFFINMPGITTMIGARKLILRLKKRFPAYQKVEFCVIIEIIVETFKRIEVIFNSVNIAVNGQPGI